MIKITDSLRERVRIHEGCVLEPYKDSLGKLTVGIGHLVQPHERKRFQEGVQITQEEADELFDIDLNRACLLYTSPSPRDQRGSRMPSSA